ncbi:hypothetical protein DY000_02047552 [Brassica cretica]|uniref:Uncharacterized protein n=1 Tax=Brassica cretica TaxID=69181 RepID=A0ABQ7F009_BRACR|nr:hypothetical protein DY000_02047552 [Brassica cretica]
MVLISVPTLIPASFVAKIPNNPGYGSLSSSVPNIMRFELQDSAFWKPARMTAYETWIGIPVSTRDEPSNDLSFEIFEQELAERYCLGSVDPSYVRTSTLGLQMGSVNLLCMLVQILGFIGLRMVFWEVLSREEELKDCSDVFFW